jgi:hypothetical protein
VARGGVGLIPPLIGSSLPDFIPHRHLKILVLTALAFLVALVAAMSIWLIRGRAEALGNHPSLTGSGLLTYMRLRADLEWLLAYLGAVVGLAVGPPPRSVIRRPARVHNRTFSARSAAA